METPYLADFHGIPNNNNVFDLELENVKTRNELIRLFYNIFFKNHVTQDKYGNKIKVDTPEQRQELLQKMISDSYVMLFIKKIGAVRDKAPDQWLRDLVSYFEKRTVKTEGMNIRLPRIVKLYRKSDMSTVKQMKVKAYSDKQARAFIIKKLRETAPEYLNPDLYGVTAELEEHDPESRWDWD